MPRDATATRERLLREAERLFATRGVYQVTAREIHEAAGQRNASALTYHFGSREGVLTQILLRHGNPMDVERGRLLAELGERADTRSLLGTLLVPYSHPLASASGRDYLRIVAQLTDMFPDWHEEGELRPPNLRRILTVLEERPPEVPVAIRRERVVGAIMLMTSAMAERARLMEGRRKLELDEPTFLGNLADMITGVLEAPMGPPF